MTWQARNPDKAAASRKRYHQRPEVAEARNAALRIRYATDQDYRAARDGWSSTYRQGLQPRLATALRTMTWALAVGRRPMPYPRVAETCFGLPLSQMEARLAADGSTDHVIPLSAFDLSDSVQIRKATHWTNVQRIPLLENCAKAYKVPEGLNLSLLPYVDTPEAKAAADAMIARASRKR